MLTVRLPEDLEAKVAQIASMEGRTKSDIVKEALREYVASRQHERSSYEAGQDLFGIAASGEHDRSQTYKRRIREKLREKQSEEIRLWVII